MYMTIQELSVKNLFASAKSAEAFHASIDRLNTEVEFTQLDVGLTGLASESGEALDILKKLKYHGKTFTEMEDKLLLELADVYFYLLVSLDAIGVSDVELANILKRKLEALNRK